MRGLSNNSNIALGVESALLLAAVVAIVHIIPYLGSITAGVFPVIMALVGRATFETIPQMVDREG